MLKFLGRYGSKAWLFVVYAFLYMPLLFLVVFSFNSTRQDGFFSGFSTRWYYALFSDEVLANSFLVSLKIALISATLATILGCFAAFTITRYQSFWGRNSFLAMISAPLVMPEVIIGLLLLLLAVIAQDYIPLFEPGMMTVVFGHTLVGMAYSTVVLQSRLQSMDRSIEEAATDLGANPATVFFLVTLPNMLPSLLAAWLLSFTLSFDDVVIAEFLSGPSITTLPQAIFGYARRGINPTIYAAATLLIVVVSVAILTYGLLLARNVKRKTEIQPK